jgi:hypothetical protein
VVSSFIRVSVGKSGSKEDLSEKLNRKRNCKFNYKFELLSKFIFIKKIFYLCLDYLKNNTDMLLGIILGINTTEDKTALIFGIIMIIGVVRIIKYFKKKHEGSAFTKYYHDLKLWISIIVFIFSLSLLNVVSTYLVNKVDIKQTCNINIDDDESIDQTVFNYVKANSHCSEIIISEEETDAYGNSQWRPWWRITGITKSEWSEMQKYNNWYYYVNSGFEKPYVVTNLTKTN